MVGDEHFKKTCSNFFFNGKFCSTGERKLLIEPIQAVFKLAIISSVS